MTRVASTSEGSVHWGRPSALPLPLPRLDSSMPSSLLRHSTAHASGSQHALSRRPRRALTTALALALAVPLLTAGPSSATPTVLAPATPVVLPMDNILSVTMYTRTSVNVRSGPSTSHSVVGGHTKGTELTGTLTSNGWLQTSSSRYVAGSVLVAEDPAEDVSGNAILNEAQKYAGIMYLYGGTSPSTGFDCSGYTGYVFGQLGISLPRTAAAQQSYATPVSSPQPGDLVFWGYPAYHVGIYAGGGQIWDSGKPGIPVQKRNIFSGVSGYGRVN